MKLTEAQKNEIRTRYANKEKVKDLAKEFGISTTTIYYALKPGHYSTTKYPTCRDLGIDKRIKLSEHEIELMQHNYNNGVNITDIARDFGVSLHCVKYHVIPGFAKYTNDLTAKAHNVNPVKIDAAHVAKLQRERITARKAAYDNQQKTK